MAEVRCPVFARGRILKIPMLEDLRDFPRDMLDCFCETLSDGIVSGLSPVVEKDRITFSKGVLKYQGTVYLVRDLTAIRYGETDTDVAIKIVFGDETRGADYKTQKFDFLIGDAGRTGKNEVELGRFRLKKGAYLRSDYQDLEDFTTLYNTINVVNVLYAGYGRPTLSHLILKYFAKAALDCNPPGHWDVSFCMTCLNNARVERETIMQYLRYRLHDDGLPDNLTNLQIHGHLVTSLEMVRREGSPRKRRPNQKTKVLVD